MKIDVVYKLGSNSSDNNKELRYSLRSLSNFKNLGKVFIVGHKPEWAQNIIHIPAKDLLTSNKDGNLIIKLSIACYHPDITEYFINMSDDQFFLKEFNLDQIRIPYFNNKLSDFKPDQNLNRWERRLKNTIHTLQARGLPSDCYESHIPCLIGVESYIRALSQFDYVSNQGMCGNTLYYNSLRTKGKQTDSSTVRIMKPCLEEELEDICRDGLFFNYTENCLNNSLYNFLEKKFPTKSQYEI